MDPFAVLGVPPGAPPEEVTAAYRRLAKRWHPDRNRAARADAQRRMAEINAAYDELREGGPRTAERDAAEGEAAAPPPGHWLPAWARRALGRELTRALWAGEQVALVAPAAMWESPRARVAVTDRRLLWLLDDVVSHRVRWLGWQAVEGVSQRLAWPRRRTAVVRVRAASGRSVSFAELAPETARALVAQVRLRIAP